jgi:hypothetical protein
MEGGCNCTIRDHYAKTIGAISDAKERGGNAKPCEQKNETYRTPQAHSTISVQKSRVAHYYKSVRLENDNESVK